MYKIVRATEGTIRKIKDTYIANNLITKDISPTFSLVTTEAVNHFEVEFTKYNRIYYVLEGILDLTFDNEHVVLNAGDSCYIQKDTEYEIRGSFKAVLVNQPAFGT